MQLKWVINNLQANKFVHWVKIQYLQKTPKFTANASLILGNFHTKAF